MTPDSHNKGHRSTGGKHDKQKSGQSVSRLGFKLGTSRTGARLIVRVASGSGMQEHRKLGFLKDIFGRFLSKLLYNKN